MSNDKIKLTNSMRKHLRILREDSGLRAEDLASLIGRSQGWITQLEVGRLVYIKTVDLNKMLINMNSSMEEFNIQFNKNNINVEFEEDNDNSSFTKIIYEILMKQYPDANRIEVSIVDNQISINTSYIETIV